MIKSIFRICLLISVSCFFVSCLSLPANMRYYVKDNIVFSASLYSDDSRRYDSLEIGTFENPFFENIPPFAFQLNGETIFSNDITISVFEKLDPGQSDPRYIGPEWPEGARCLFLPGYSILIYKEKIFVFYVRNSKESFQPVPKIGVIGQKNLYSLPLTEDEVVEIFGKEDEFKDFFMQ